VLALLAPASAGAAVAKPKAKRLITTARVFAGPSLGGDRLAWAGAKPGSRKTTLFTQYRRRLTTADLTPPSGEFVNVYTVAATPRTVAYYSAEEESDIRDTYPSIHYFGGLTRNPTRVRRLNMCIVREGCTFREGDGVDATDGYVAYGPFGDPENEDGDLMLVADTSDGLTNHVDVPDIARGFDSFRIGGRFLAFRTNAAEIVVVDWRRNRVVRTLRPPASSGYVRFAVDRAGRVAIGRSISHGRSTYGVYDTKGRLRTFRVRDPENRPGRVWIENGRVAYTRTSTTGNGQAWEVTDLRGRVIASRRAPRTTFGLTDFDGHCLAWAGESRGFPETQALYVAAVGRVPKTSICSR
jgi:hypothetical protein